MTVQPIAVSIRIVAYKEQTYLLPSMNHLLVPHKTLPGQSRYLSANAHDRRVLALKQLTAARSQRLPLRHEMPLDQAKGPIDESTGTDIQQTDVPRTEAQSPLGEAMLRDVTVGGRQDGALRRPKGSRRGRVIVGVEGAWAADGGLLAKRPEDSSPRPAGS